MQLKPGMRKQKQAARSGIDADINYWRQSRIRIRGTYCMLGLHWTAGRICIVVGHLLRSTRPRGCCELVLDSFLTATQAVRCASFPVFEKKTASFRLMIREAGIRQGPSSASTDAVVLYTVFSSGEISPGNARKRDWDQTPDTFQCHVW